MTGLRIGINQVRTIKMYYCSTDDLGDRTPSISFRLFFFNKHIYSQRADISYSVPKTKVIWFPRSSSYFGLDFQQK